MISLLLLPVLALGAAQPLNETIILDTGTIQGNPRDPNGTISFKGIPYAEPPVGDLRWRSPQSAKNRSAILNATAFGNSCYGFSQPAMTYYTSPGEDCLYINVWTNAITDNEKLPVMVWIYGGGLQFGTSSDPKYDGSALSGKEVVLVSFNYRLGALGFLALPELDDEGNPSGNFGLQDQLLALTWVKENIASFGGDPDSVTIFGQSAGGHSVSMLMSSPLAPGLFHKAIIESGALWDGADGPVDTKKQARQKGSELKDKLKAESISDLRAASAEDVVAAGQWPVTTDVKLTAYSPSIDNYVLTDAPGRVFASRKQLKVPLLAGWVADEQLIFFTLQLPFLTTSAYETAARRYFGDRMSEFLSLYPDSSIIERANSSSVLCGDMEIRENTFTAAQLQHDLGSDTWVYYYTYTSDYSPIPYHTAEIPFVFGTLDAGTLLLPPSEQDVAFSDNVMSYWTNFAKTGNPNGQGLSEWPFYGGNGSGILELGNTVKPIDYDVDGLQYLASFRQDGVLPHSWRNATADLNSTSVL